MLPSTHELLENTSLIEYQLVVITNHNLKQHMNINSFCRKHNIKFISAMIAGPYSQLFCDFGEKFEILDKNGE